jgi:hypothetical protein
MNYETICAQNVCLYAELENYTNQINACKASIDAEKLQNDISMLQSKKKGIQELIDMNLDKLEEIWSIENTSYRSANNIVATIEPMPIDLLVIKSFIRNPNQQEKEIAEEFGLSPQRVGTIITNYLQHKYKLTA